MIRIDPVSIARLGMVVFSAIFALLLPSAAQAACEQWDVSGKWNMAQSNINGPVFFTLVVVK